MDNTDACGFLLNDSSILSLLDANLTKPVYTGQPQLSSIYGSAAVCVVSHALKSLTTPSRHADDASAGQPVDL